MLYFVLNTAYWAKVCNMFHYGRSYRMTLSRLNRHCLGRYEDSV